MPMMSIFHLRSTLPQSDTLGESTGSVNAEAVFNDVAGHFEAALGRRTFSS
jgi:hypothetical protein